MLLPQGCSTLELATVLSLEQWLSGEVDLRVTGLFDENAVIINAVAHTISIIVMLGFRNRNNEVVISIFMFLF